MIRSRILAAVCLLSLASVAACTATATTDEEATASESELRSLSSSEIVGEIPFGAAVDVAHSGTPRYRAYWFNAQAGDKLDVWVRSQNTDARAWLLDESFRTLKWNNDANATNDAEDDATTTDANIKYDVPRTGKYYVAFRGQLGAAANFSVRVDRTSTQPPIDPPQSGNPWGCSGTPLSNAERRAHPDGRGHRLAPAVGGTPLRDAHPHVQPADRLRGVGLGHAGVGQRRRAREPLDHDERGRRGHAAGQVGE